MKDPQSQLSREVGQKTCGSTGDIFRISYGLDSYVFIANEDSGSPYLAGPECACVLTAIIDY